MAGGGAMVTPEWQPLSEAFVLAAGATQVVEGTMTISAGQQPSFKGK